MHLPEAPNPRSQAEDEPDRGRTGPGPGFFPGRGGRRALGLCLATLLAACEPGAVPEPVVQGVQLWCAQPSIDFGTVWEGSVLEHEFRFLSRGSEPALVQGARADCGCTVAELERVTGGARVAYADGAPLENGAELFVKVTYDTTGKSGTGERQVKLFCNELDGMAEVSVLADVQRRFRTEPDPPPSVSMAIGRSGEVAFDVVGMTEEPFALEHEQRGLPPAVVIALQASDPDPRGRSTRWRVNVACGPETPRGTHSYPIFLRTDLGREDRPEPGATHSFAPFVIVQVLGRFSAKPQALSFGALALDETAARTVRLSCNDPDFAFAEPAVTIEPLSAERSLAWAERATIQARAVPGESAWDVELVLEGLVPETDDTFLGRLDIRTGHPLEPLIQVNVSGFRSDRGRR